MLDLDRFLKGFQLLCDRFNNGHTKERVTTLYHVILSQHLNDEQFDAAVLISFQHDRYFPSPQELIDKVLNTHHEKALEAWQKVITANPRECFNWNDATGWECLRLIGGLRYVHDCDVEKISFLRHEFVAAYESRLGRLAHAPSPDALRLLAGSGHLAIQNKSQGEGD